MLDPATGAVVRARADRRRARPAWWSTTRAAALYVVGRFRNQLQTLSTREPRERSRVAGIGFDPTPDAIVNGRKFFYGGFTSGHGDQACASCHLFGDFDNLAWDLGDPQRQLSAPPPPGMIDPLLEGFHPMKGPMTTQSLRGAARHRACCTGAATAPTSARSIRRSSA